MVVQHKVRVGQSHVFLGKNATSITTVAQKFPTTDIYFEKGDCRHNAASLLGLLSMGISEGDYLTIIADAPDEKTAKQAIQEIEKIVA